MEFAILTICIFHFQMSSTVQIAVLMSLSIIIAQHLCTAKSLEVPETNEGIILHLLSVPFLVNTSRNTAEICCIRYCLLLSF